MKELIRKIRNQTGAGVVDIKKALDEAGGNEEKTIEILRSKGLEKADKKGGRETKEGLIGSYVHSNGKIAAMVKVLCETDFVARNEEFVELAKDLAMQVAAMDPKCIAPQDLPDELLEQQKALWKTELEKESKPDEIKQKILSGKEQKYRDENSLMKQKFVKNQEQTVEELIKEKISKTGENIVVENFVRMVL